MSSYEGEATLWPEYGGSVYLTHVKLDVRGNTWFGVGESVVLPRAKDAVIEFPNGVRANALITAHITRDVVAIAINGQGEVPLWSAELGE